MKTQDDHKFLRILYPEGPKSLHVGINDVVFWIDGIEKNFKHPLHSHILIGLAQAYPNTVSSEDLFSQFQKLAGVGSKLNLENTVHKYVHGVRQDLVRAGLKMEVIRNVRSLGYRLSEGWHVERPSNPESLLNEELAEVRNLVRRCLEHVEQNRVVTNKGGLSYLDFDQQFVKENMITLDRIGWQLIHSLSEPEFVPDILDIKRELWSLYSYVIFWRVGHRYNEQDWKSDYRAEIHKVLGDIEMKISKIKMALQKRSAELPSQIVLGQA